VRSVVVGRGAASGGVAEVEKGEVADEGSVREASKLQEWIVHLHMREQAIHSNQARRVTMAAIRVPSTAFLSAFLPIARATLLPDLAPITRRIPLLQQLRTSLLPAAFLPIPSLLGELWDGLLRAVPKKKTSHMKKRHRFMAGKGLKDVTALNKCSACGRAKRAHVLCPYCVQSTSTVD